MSDDVRYVWIDRDGDRYDEEPFEWERKSYGPFTRYRLEPDPEPVPVPDEPTKPYAVVEADGTFDNEGNRVCLIRAHRIDGSGDQNWIEFGPTPKQDYFVWTWARVSERNPKIIFEGVDL
jgi:hypothetical protein